MNNRLYKLILASVIGSASGASVYAAYSSVLGELPVYDYLFFPSLFATVSVSVPLVFRSKAPVAGNFVTGLLSGLVYGLISPLFPLFAALITGASIGGGLAKRGEKPGAALEMVVMILKGAFWLPVAIFLGGSVIALSGLTGSSPMLLWLLWGGCLGLGLGIILVPVFGRSEGISEIQGSDDIGVFKIETSQIRNDLRSLESNYDL